MFSLRGFLFLGLLLREDFFFKEKMGEGSPYPKGRNPLSTTNQGEGSPYPKERNSLSTTNQGEDMRRFSYTKGRNPLKENLLPSSPWFVVERGFLPLG
jgi:hypothetical protein